jgi:hypothetical protein
MTHDFILTKDEGWTKRYRCSKCKSIAVFRIIPDGKVCSTTIENPIIRDSAECFIRGEEENE